MLAVRTQIRDHAKTAAAKVKKSCFKSLEHAGAVIRLRAQRSIRKRKGPSKPGRPPHTRFKFLPKTIVYAVDHWRGSVVIGPAATLAGKLGAAHEHGGVFRRRRYPPRPFMSKAFEASKSRLPKLWAGSVH